MLIRDHLSEISALIGQDLDQAFTLMATDLHHFVESEDDQSMPDFLLFGRISGMDEAGHGARLKRQQHHHNQIVRNTASLYKGVPDNLKDVGHSAFHSGLHAQQLHKSKTAPHKMKSMAHDDAHDSHMTAAEKLKKAGFEKQAIFHMAAADHHQQKKTEIRKDEGVRSDLMGAEVSLAKAGRSQDRLQKSLAAGKAARAARDARDSWNAKMKAVGGPIAAHPIGIAKK